MNTEHTHRSVLAIAGMLAALSPQERAQRLDARAPKPPRAISRRERARRRTARKIANASRRRNRVRR